MPREAWGDGYRNIACKFGKKSMLCRPQKRRLRRFVESIEGFKSVWPAVLQQVSCFDFQIAVYQRGGHAFGKNVDRQHTLTPQVDERLMTPL